MTDLAPAAQTSEPRTAAGRAFIGRLHKDYLYHSVDGRRDEHIAAILAIEAEAQRLTVERLERAFYVVNQPTPPDEPEEFARAVAHDWAVELLAEYNRLAREETGA